MWKTRVTELLGIEYPIIGGPMQWLSKAPFVSAISNAGALGSVADNITNIFRSQRTPFHRGP